jgi:hypothetical protein
MDKNESDFNNEAMQRMESLREEGHVTGVRYNVRSSCLEIKLNTMIEIRFPAALIEGLSEAATKDLRDIEITPSGLGLHWPRLDVDLYIPSLIQGKFGSKSWMAKQLGVLGGKRKSEAKTKSSRENGRKGGRPKQALKKSA